MKVRVMRISEDLFKTLDRIRVDTEEKRMKSRAPKKPKPKKVSYVEASKILARRVKE